MKLKSKEKHLYKLPIKKQSSFGKINGENYSTTSQLKMFATLIKEGSLVEASIDTADNNRMPPKQDIRKMLVPVGPVIVFGASNFSLHFLL